MQTLLEKYVLNGGVLMFVLVPCSVIMAAAVLQGWIVLRRGWVLPRWILRRAGQARDEEARQAYFELLQKHHSPLARVLWQTLRDFSGLPRAAHRQAFESRLEEAIILVTDKMYERVGLLSTIYTVGPLLGLVGTILGLMEVFHSYAAVDQPSVAMLAVGVQKALVTTFWGLSMAIPAYVAGQWMQARIRLYERDLLPEAAWRVIETLYGPAAESAKEEEPADVEESAPFPARVESEA